MQATLCTGYLGSCSCCGVSCQVDQLGVWHAGLGRWLSAQQDLARKYWQSFCAGLTKLAEGRNGKKKQAIWLRMQPSIIAALHLVLRLASGCAFASTHTLHASSHDPLHQQCPAKGGILHSKA